MAATALSTIHPKCRPRVPTALPNALKANTAASVTTIQCRADAEAIEGAAISSTPPAIQATVGTCQTKRNSVRSRCGWMVTRGNTLVSDSTPWIKAAAIAMTPETCNKKSCIGSSIQLCMDLDLPLAPVNTVVYGGGMTDQLSAQDWLDPGLQDPGPHGLLWAQSGAAGQGDGRLARQLLLALWRYRCIPCGHPESLARDRRRGHHLRY